MIHPSTCRQEKTPRGVPATAKIILPESIKLHSVSKAQFSPKVEEDKLFMEVLTSWSSKWMWSDLRLVESSEWVVECLKNRTLVCVTDSSYQKKKTPILFSAGWIMACKNTGRCITGTLVEESPNAGSYRGEMLG